MNHRNGYRNRMRTEDRPMLARQDTRHYISCASDGGQIHLKWRHVRLDVAPSELLAMADFFLETVPRLKTNSLLGNSLYCVLQDEEDNFEVWVLGVGLYMAPDEFKRFMKLIVEGAEAVESVARFVAMNEGDKGLLH